MVLDRSRTGRWQDSDPKLSESATGSFDGQVKKQPGSRLLNALAKPAAEFSSYLRQNSRNFPGESSVYLTVFPMFRWPK
jgi:hypothetical protein